MRQLDKKAIGARLRALRLKRGKTMREVADSIYVTVNHIGQIELGKKCFSVNTLDILSEYYGVTTDWILRGDSDD